MSVSLVQVMEEKCQKVLFPAEGIVVGPEYDKENLASLHGGSASEVTFAHFWFFMKGKNN